MRSALWLILGVTALRLAYLAFLCPYTLIEDEAHYWEWSRRLALSYYSKGPGIAWFIAATTSIAGETQFGVRLGAPLASAVGAVFVALLGAQASPDRRTPFFCAACWFLAPMLQVLGLVLTIDGPYAACWAAAAFGAWSALGRARAWGWVLFGAALGLGTLFKYTMLLALPGPLLVAAFFPARAGSVRTRLGAVCGAGLFALLVLPIILWNQREGWPTLQHLLGHLGVAGGDMPVTPDDGDRFNPLWTLSLVGTQVAVIGPILFMALWEAWHSLRDPRSPTRGVDRFLVVMAAPIFLFYLVVSLFARPEGNWPLAGCITLLPFAARRVVVVMDHLARSRPCSPGGVRLPPMPRTRPQWLWYGAIVLGACVALAIPGLDVLHRIPVVGSFIPLHRFGSARSMATHADRLLARLSEETDLRPFVVCLHYGRASELAFYLPGQPVVYCASSLIGAGRRTQYDYWPDTDLRHAPELIGRPALVVGGSREDWAQAFESVEEVGPLDGDGKRGRSAFLCTGFRGFSETSRPLARE